MATVKYVVVEIEKEVHVGGQTTLEVVQTFISKERYRFQPLTSHFLSTFVTIYTWVTRLARKNQSSLLLTNKQRCTITLPALEFPVRDLVHCKMAALPRGKEVSLSTFWSGIYTPHFPTKLLLLKVGKLSSRTRAVIPALNIFKKSKWRESEGPGFERHCQIRREWHQLHIQTHTDVRSC